MAHAPVSPTARRDIEVPLAEITALDPQIVGYDADVKQIAKHADARRLQTIPGGVFTTSGCFAWLETETKRVGCPVQTLASSA